MLENLHGHSCDIHVYLLIDDTSLRGVERALERGRELVHRGGGE